MHLENPSNHLRIELLNKPCQQLKPLTFPRYRSFLDAPTFAPSNQAFGVAAWLGGLPVGLALLSHPSLGSVRDLLSIQTSPLFRRYGMAAKLLDAVESLARERGTQTLRCEHSSRMTRAADFAAWLRHTGWSEPLEIEHRLASHASWAVQVQEAWRPFLTRLQKKGFEATPWGNINDADRQAIQAVVAHQFTDVEHATRFDPLPYDAADALVLPLSLILRQHGQVVGWILAQKQALPGPPAFSYPRGYVVPALRKAGWLIGGIHAVCMRQIEAFGDQSMAIFEMAPSNTDMRRFAQRQLKPTSVWTDIRYQSTKIL